MNSLLILKKEALTFQIQKKKKYKMIQINMTCVTIFSSYIYEKHRHVTILVYHIIS